MTQKIIRLCYRKVIDSNVSTRWEQYVFNDTYQEYVMQSQLYNAGEKYTSFSELVKQVPAAEKLHYLVSAAVVGHLKQLNGIVPDIKNTTGKLFLPFKNYRFEILESNIQNKAVHIVTINFISEPLVWQDTVDNRLLLSLNDNKDVDGALLTEMMALPPQLSIFSLKNIVV